MINLIVAVTICIILTFQIINEYSFISFKNVFETYKTIFAESYISISIIIINSCLLTFLLSQYINIEKYNEQIMTIVSIIATLFITISSILSIVPNISYQKNKSFFLLIKETNAINIFCIVLCIAELSLSLFVSSQAEENKTKIIMYLQLFLIFFIFYHILITAKRLFAITTYTISLMQNTDSKTD